MLSESQSQKVIYCTITFTIRYFLKVKIGDGEYISDCQWSGEGKCVATKE